MQRTITLLTGLTLSACLPQPKDAGELPSTDTGDTGDAGGAGGADGGATVADSGDGPESGELPPEATIESALELGADDFIVRMIRSPEGIVVAVQGDPAAPDPASEVRAYSSSLELLWSHTLADAGIADLDALDGGEYLAAGSVFSAGTNAPAVWRVSCCADVVSQVYPQSGDHSGIVVAERHGDGILLAVDDVAIGPYLMEIPLGLIPASPGDPLPNPVYWGATTPDGNMLLRLDAGDVDMLYEIEVDGTSSGFAFGGTTVLVGTGEDLTFMTFGEDEVEIKPFASDTWVTVPIPGFTFPYDTLVVDRHERVVLVHHEQDYDGPLTLFLSEFGDDGVVARTLAIPHQQYERATTSGVAVGEDGAIYLAVNEYDGAGARANYLLRIAPL